MNHQCKLRSDKRRTCVPCSQQSSCITPVSTDLSLRAMLACNMLKLPDLPAADALWHGNFVLLLMMTLNTLMCQTAQSAAGLCWHEYNLSHHRPVFEEHASRHAQAFKLRILLFALCSLYFFAKPKMTCLQV
ncbi:hypothetical protein ABBQ32_013190 [Trebouxia sp. C0010 RCD-2024]